MMQVGAKNLITDVKGILVGNAHDEVMKTGVSVCQDRPRLPPHTASWAVPPARGKPTFSHQTKR